ncbi:MAG: prephenate dehydratase [Microbacterium gubbeenense]|uniref:prephenate dehydratase n=2 Tax=Microbacterium gubbeenense TaxID=159896 RepID=UPI003F944DFF
MSHESAAPRTYSYLGPAGTFTEAALAQVDEARGQVWKPVSNVAQALADVQSGESHGAMIAIENTVEGGVSSAQDALANTPGLRIVGEYLVPVAFVVVGPRGSSLADVTGIAAHPVAYAQCLDWLGEFIPGHSLVVAGSNVASAIGVLDGSLPAHAAIAAPGVVDHYDVEVLAENIGDNPDAVTRFVLVTRTVAPPERTGADKTSLIVELPREAPGGLVDLLEQFATRGINLSLIQSRPIGDRLGRYRFVIDADGHIADERMADALMGLKRFSPHVMYLGSYPRADRVTVAHGDRYTDASFADARDWLRGLLSGIDD